MWTKARVLEAAAAWSWTPYDATTVDTGELALDVVQGKASPRRWTITDPHRLIEHAIAVAKANGAHHLEFRVHDLTQPPGLAEALHAHGAVPSLELDIAAHVLGSPLSLDAPAVEIETVVTAHGLRRVYGVETEAFEKPYPTEEYLNSDAATLSDPNKFRFLATVDGDPAGVAGMTLDGEVARMWGAGVKPSYRRRGIYRALTKARLEVASARGATLALVTARQGTSAPILRAAGFRAYGTETRFLLTM